VTELVLVDYGAGNLRSLRAAFARLGAAARVSDDPAEVLAARRIVLPGVGAAAPAMERLRARGLAEALLGAVFAGAHLLGVCLGMQLLFERSAEGDTPCLGLLRGGVRRLDWAARTPHMGWNDVLPRADHALSAALPAVCYFAHSYVATPASADAVVGVSELDGREFASLVCSGRVVGAQFHPEKSGASGRAFLDAYLRTSGDAP
jgi:glutamine amidotransferase